MPGTAFARARVRAGDQVGCGRVAELTLERPLVLPADGAVQIQVTRRRARRERDRARSRCTRARAGRPDAPWTGTRAGPCSRRPAARAPELRGVAARRRRAGRRSTACTTGWPMPGSTTARLPGRCARVWRRGDELFAEVALPDAPGRRAARLRPAPRAARRRPARARSPPAGRRERGRACRSPGPARTAPRRRQPRCACASLRQADGSRSPSRPTTGSSGRLYRRAGFRPTRTGGAARRLAVPAGLATASRPRRIARWPATAATTLAPGERGRTVPQ